MSNNGAMSKHFFVNPQTGKVQLQIPLAVLFADEGMESGYSVALSCDPASSVLSLMEAGTYEYLGGDEYKVERLKLSDGRVISGTTSTRVIAGADFTARLLWDKVVVHLKSGAIEVFERVAKKTTDPLSRRETFNVGLTRYILPSGRALNFKWDLNQPDDYPHLLSIENEQGVLLEAKWGADSIEKLFLFADDGEKLSYAFSGEQSNLSISCDSDSSGGLRYKVEGVGSKKVDEVKLTVTRTRSLPAEGKDAATVESSSCVEIIKYADASRGKVSRYESCPGGGLEKFYDVYTYKTDKTLICSYQGVEKKEVVSKDKEGKEIKEIKDVPKQVAAREVSFENGVLLSDVVESFGVKGSAHYSLTKDVKRSVAIMKTTQKVADVVVDEITVEYDAVGNLISYAQGELMTEYTYFNDYKSYTVTEVGENYQDTSFFGIIFKAFDYLNPIGLGFVAFGSSGLSWGTKISTTVDMDVAANDYAKDAFHLPVAVKYPGSPAGFSAHVESISSFVKDGSSKRCLSITYFGYSAFTPKTIEDITHKHVALPALKLTVFEPDYQQVDVSAEQLNIAKAAAKKLVDSLTKQAGATNNEKDKKSYLASLDDLNKSLVAQSKVNALGPKLGAWRDGSMRVETLSYCSDSVGFGQLASSSVYLLDGKGEEIKGSKTTTDFSYGLDATNKRKLTVTTKVTTGDATTYSSSQVRSTLSGRIYENTDSNDMKTLYTYNKGELEKVKVSQGAVVVDEVTYSATALKGGKTQYQTHSTRTKEYTRLIRDELGREVETSLSFDGKTWLKTSSTAYDSSGRTRSLDEHDYDAAYKKSSTRSTTWSYDATANKCTATLVLKDASDKQVDSKTQVLERTATGETLTHNTFKVVRQHDAAKRVTTEMFGKTGEAQLKVVKGFTAAGYLDSIKYLSQGKDKNEVEIDNRSFKYTAGGLLKTDVPKVGKASEFTYDSFGRLLTSTTNGVEVGNVYSSTSQAAVAISGHVKDASGKIVVGAQSLDGLGRLISQTVNGSKAEFKYSGTSSWAKRSDVGNRPSTLSGYKSELSSNGLEYSEIITSGKTIHKSRALYSTRGIALEFEGLLGGKTSYRYDAFGRIIKSGNGSCESTFEYADGGQLIKETIKAIKKNLTMVVTYGYDVAGLETSRTFTCDGFDTHVIERTLLGDGRLKKSTLKVKAAEKRSDSYEYDDCNRLKSWSCTGGGVANHNGKNYVQQTFTYDALSNVVSRANQSYTGSTRPATLDSDNSTYTYDADKPGVLTTSGKDVMKSDAKGRLIQRVGRSITYHPNGQINTYSATADGKSTYTFAYDDLSRIRGGSTGEWSDTYHYRGNQIYAVVQTDSRKIHGFTERTLVLQNDSPSCLMQDAVTKTSDTTSTETCSFELRDSAGSVFASLDLEKKTVTYYVYSPYGYREPRPASVTWLGFKGEPLNILSLYHRGNGYRLYDPQLHRFQTPDSWSPFGEGGVSPYAFAGSDPVNYQDPSGHQRIAEYQRLGSAPWMYSDAFQIGVSVIAVLAAPFTAGASLAFSIASTGLALVSAAFNVASFILRDSDPRLARILGDVGFGLGLASDIVGGMGGMLKGAARSATSQGAGAFRSRVTRTLERANKNVTAQGFTRLSNGSGPAFDLYHTPGSNRLLINSHGLPVDGLSFAGAPVPEYFKTNVASRVGFYADPGFRSSMLGRNYSDLITGAYSPALANQYRTSGLIPNYKLSKITTAELLWEHPQFAKIPNFRVSGTFGEQALKAGVDYLRPLQEITLEQTMNILEAHGYNYSVVDGFFCRGTNPSTMSNGLKRSAITAFHRAKESLNGVMTF